MNHDFLFPKIKIFPISSRCDWSSEISADKGAEILVIRFSIDFCKSESKSFKISKKFSVSVVLLVDIFTFLLQFQLQQKGDKLNSPILEGLEVFRIFSSPTLSRMFQSWSKNYHCNGHGKYSACTKIDVLLRQSNFVVCRGDHSWIFVW